MLKKIINFLKKAKRVTNTFETKLEYSQRSNYLLNSALISKESIIIDRYGADDELIVSLTTYSKRINDVHLIIESIAHQTLKPNRIILWLDEGEFSLDTIPLVLKKQISRGLEVRFCPNYKSYKKLIPTLQHFPDANIVTIDDDILYPYDMIEMLYREHRQYPECIIGHRAHKIQLDASGEIRSYKNWELESLDCQASELMFITTGGGTLFPRNSLPKETMDTNVFLSLCPNADDVWFKAMSLVHGRKHKKVSDNRDFWTRFLLLEESQDIALYNDNKKDDGNDKQILTVFKKFDIYRLLK